MDRPIDREYSRRGLAAEWMALIVSTPIVVVVTAMAYLGWFGTSPLELLGLVVLEIALIALLFNAADGVKWQVRNFVAGVDETLQANRGEFDLSPGRRVFAALKAFEALLWRWLTFPLMFVVFMAPMLWGMSGAKPWFLDGYQAQILASIVSLALFWMLASWRTKFLCTRDFDLQWEASRRAPGERILPELQILRTHIRVYGLTRFNLAILPWNRTPVTDTTRYARNVESVMRSLSELSREELRNRTGSHFTILKELEDLGKISEMLHHRLFWWLAPAAILVGFLGPGLLHPVALMIARSIWG